MIGFKRLRHLFNLGLTVVTFSVLSGSIVFAETTGSGVAQAGEPSANVFIRLKDVQLNFRNRDNIQNTNTVLGPGSVIQIPSGLAKFNQDGSINLNATMEYWVQFAQYQQEYTGNTALLPRSWNCPHLDESVRSCNGVDRGELFFPVKIVQASDSNFDTDGRDSYGYIALDYLRNNIQPHRYETVHTTLENALNIPQTTQAPDTVVAGGDSSFAGGQSEVTGNDTSAAPAQPIAPAPVDSNVMNCSNTTYSRSNYTNTSCLRNLSLKQKAELVMRDVLRINQLRSSFNLDPRLSVCMAYRESRFSPNAKGGTPDWGMYQVIDSTGAGVLRRNNPVTPGFSQYRYNWSSYRDNMIRSTLAQADLHHSVLKEKASHAGLISRVNSGSSDVSLYQTLATRYNGSGSRARHYGQKIANCYRSMLGIADRNGNITGSASALQSALNRALN